MGNVLEVDGWRLGAEAGMCHNCIEAAGSLFYSSVAGSTERFPISQHCRP